jgi:hypothetical protein
MLFSDFPGNKLYLFLARELSPHSEDWHEANRKRLLPLHGPGNALYSNSWAERIRYIPANTRYGLMRAGFHAREGIRYLSEQWRWKRRVGHTALLEPGSE